MNSGLWLIRKLLPDGYTMPRRRPYVSNAHLLEKLGKVRSETQAETRLHEMYPKNGEK